MQRFAVGLVMALLASGVLAQQAQRQQMQHKEAPAASQAQSSSGGGQLSGQKKLQVYQQALKVPKLDTGALGTPARITPRNLYVNGTTYAWVKSSTVAPSEGPTGVSHIFPAVSGNMPMLELHFRAQANKQYIVDCAIKTGGPVRPGVGGSATPTVDGHFVHAVASTAQERPVTLQLTAERGFEWTMCEIVPVNR